MAEKEAKRRAVFSQLDPEDVDTLFNACDVSYRLADVTVSDAQSHAQLTRAYGDMAFVLRGIVEERGN